MRYLRRAVIGVLVLIAFTSLASCRASSTRSYSLGFTPFAYAMTEAALEDTYAHIASDGDMIAQHLGQYGVPWDEALSDAFPYNANVMAEWQTRKAHTPPGHRVYLALNPINQERHGLANLWGPAGPDLPLAAPWDRMDLNDPRVKIAYLNYCRRAIAYFNPDYVAIGIEVNQVMAYDPALWAKYLDLHKAVYTASKAFFPNLPIMVSLTANDLLGYVGSNTSNQDQARSEIANYSDYFCLSMYLYIGSNSAGNFPADAFTRLAAMTSKPIAICETGYPSQSFTLRAPGVPPVFAMPILQERFIDRLFRAADEESYRFIVYFFVRDLDESLDINDIVRLFKNDGLYDRTGKAKPALALWKQRLEATLREPSAGGLMPRDWLNSSPATADSAVDTQANAPASVRNSRTFVYTNDNRNPINTVSSYALDVDGSLRVLPGSRVPTGGEGTATWRGVLNDIVVTSSGFLYVANHASGSVSAFSIESQSGRLTAVRGMPFVAAGWTAGELTLAVDPAEDVLLVCHTASGTIVTFAIAPDGALTQRGPEVDAGGAMTSVKVTPDSRFVTATTTNGVRAFRLGSTGSITAVPMPASSRVVSAASLDIACSTGLVYVANGSTSPQSSSTIEILRLGESGAMESVTMRPFGSGVGANGSVLRLSPDDRFAFVTNQGVRGHGGDSISAFRWTNQSFVLAPASPFAVGSQATPIGMAITKAGEFLLTANYPETRRAAPSIGVFSIAPDGSLTRGPGSPVPVPDSHLSSLAIFPPSVCSRAVR